MGRAAAFTLAELLIALAILGVIATFTIPKVLQSQTDSKYNSIAKEAAGMISGAYDAYKLTTPAAGTTGPQHLTPFMNYVRVDTASTIDAPYNSTTRDCSSGGIGSGMCLILHNGAALRLGGDTINFGGTGTNNAIWFMLDPDGKVTTGSTTGPGKSLMIFLYYNGRVTTRDAVVPNTITGGDMSSPFNPGSSNDPPWFSWN